MLSHLPLDDQLNRLFYMEGAPWRLVYAQSLGRCVFRREANHLDIAYAMKLIATGDLLWGPPDDFERLDDDMAPESVQLEHGLLCAFLRSPVGQGVDRWTQTRLQGRLSDDRDWLARHAVSSGDPDAMGGEA
jgi:hypothetical protein